MSPAHRDSGHWRSCRRAAPIGPFGSGDAARRPGDSRRSDLIVTGSRGLGGLARILLGSVARNVAVHAPCSVLVVRGSAAIERARPHA
ncbi:MAG: universal stress protein [Candidatus Limnocylindria bacterium]